MAWTINGTKLTMAEGDYGVQIPITFTGGTITSSDEIMFILNSNGTTILTKTFSNIEHNTINLEITAAETALLPVGEYSYGLDWYQNGAFMDNVIPTSQFKVIRKEKQS